MRTHDMTFYLGAHHPGWLSRLDIPLFISRRRLVGYKTLPVARSPWALDSGGFTELNKHGSWDAVPAEQYADEVKRFSEGCGKLQWAAIQDWMCEPFVLKKTGLTLAEHQRRTVRSYLDLKSLAPDLPWAPVLQGWSMGDYLRCVDLYDAHGVDLASLPIVGIGSVCRRQATAEAARIIRRIAGMGIALHGFGFKKSGLPDVADALASADSMAWSFAARKRPPLPGCTTHQNCANCWRWATRWYRELMASLKSLPARQMDLFSEGIR